MFCANCGTGMQEEDLFCGVCGTPVGQDEIQTAAQEYSSVYTPEQEQQPPDYMQEQPYNNTTQPVYRLSRAGKHAGSINKWPIILTVCIAACAIVLGVGLYYLLGSGNSLAPDPAPVPDPALAPAPAPTPAYTPTPEPSIEKPIQAEVPVPAPEAPPFEQEQESVPAPVTEPDLSAYEKLVDSLNGTRDGVILVMAWSNNEVTVFERECNSQIWMMQSRDVTAANAYREVSPAFSFDHAGEVIKIGFPTTTRLYHLYKDGTGHFSNTDGTKYEGLTWEYTITPG